MSQEEIQIGKGRQTYQGSGFLSELCCCWAELCWPWERQERARSRWLHAQVHLAGLSSNGWIPRPPSRRSLLPFMSCSHQSPLGQKLPATFASFQPSCFICLASGPRPAPKPPEARKIGKDLQHHLSSLQLSSN